MKFPFIVVLIVISLTRAEQIVPPEDKTYYISGIAFDTKTYCADFHEVIARQAAKIRALEAEVAQLRLWQQQHLKEKTKPETSTNRNSQPAIKTKSKIIISDKPL